MDIQYGGVAPACVGFAKARSGGQESEDQPEHFPRAYYATLLVGSRVTLAMQRAKKDAKLKRSKIQQAVDQGLAKQDIEKVERCATQMP